MPRAAPHPCAKCRRNLVAFGVRHCAACAPKVAAADIAYRGTAAARGYDHEWAAVRRAYAAAHPWCEDCAANGRAVPVAIVHHKIEPRGDRALLLDPSNCRSACRSCHMKEHGRRAAPGYVAPRAARGSR